jgi:outer membrane protein
VKLATALVAAIAVSASARGQDARTAPPPLVLVHPDQPSPAPVVLTLQDALQRARDLDAQYQTNVADAAIARGDRAQAKAGLLPSLSATTQYLGNSPTPNNVNPNGRYVSLDGVKMYRAWGVLHQDISPATFAQTPLHKAEAAEAAALARVEVAQRGLVVTVTRNYYGLVAAERKYATAQLAAQQSARFLEIAQQQERLGQVARSDVVKAEISDRQQQQGYRDATLAMDNARLILAVLLSPTLNENFTVVDDLHAAPPLPPFDDVRGMAGRGNPELRAADEALKAAAADVSLARNAFYPTLLVEAVYGIEANEFALHSRIAAQPELGVLPNLGYFVTLNLSVPIWDWGGLRSKVHQSEARRRLAEVTLSQTQRQLLSNLYSMYNEALAARSAVENLQRVAELAAESLRLTNLRYQAGESTALEVVDAQNTLVQSRNAADDAELRYRVALAQLQTVTGNFQ